MQENHEDKRAALCEMTAELATLLGSSTIRELTAEEMESVVGGDFGGNGGSL